MSQITRKKIQVLVVGVENYQDLPKLYGPSADVERLRELFVSNPDIAAFDNE